LSWPPWVLLLLGTGILVAPAEETRAVCPSRRTRGRSRWWGCWLESLDEAAVLRAGEPLLEHLKHPRQVHPRQGGRVQPQPGKHLAVVSAVRLERERFVLAFPQHEPVDRLILHAPDEVLADAVA